ncbi:hypothetical protein DB30_07139 [Enhygromyxa salina]|uniref:Uncharacterized protein n=1 Tax=Enhygromyxa salina TaxID=215803 RepID=A0A0C2A5Z6_9BACT|nr:hypothetical protein DB30_07139 [Enhygromyxa salina]
MVLSVGCEAPARPVQERRRADKRSLFADASLVPTREGERIRRELALAGELTTALELLEFGPVHVDLELRAEHGSAVVVAQPPAHTDASVEQLEAEVAELAGAIVPELAPNQIHVWLRPRPEPPAPKRDRSWALTLACLGLGLSLGVTLERVRMRRLA